MSKTPTIIDVDWKCEVVLSRSEVHNIARLAQYADLIKTALITDGYKELAKELDWQDIKRVFYMFRDLAQQDTDFCDNMNAMLQDMAEE